MRLSSTELPNTGIKQVMSLPSVQLSRLNGTAENLLDSTGRVLLVVNGASQCGFAPQYKDLEALYHRHMGTFLHLKAAAPGVFGTEALILRCPERE